MYGIIYYNITYICIDFHPRVLSIRLDPPPPSTQRSKAQDNCNDINNMYIIYDYNTIQYNIYYYNSCAARARPPSAVENTKKKKHISKINEIRPRCARPRRQIFGSIYNT